MAGCVQASVITNLYSGETYYLGYACIDNVITAHVTQGFFNYVSIERSDGTDMLYSLPYNGAGPYTFSNVSFPDCGSNWCVVLH